MYFRKYGPRKTLLHNGLKSPVSKDPLTGNMVNGQKYCFNFSDITFTIFIHHSQGN